MAVVTRYFDVTGAGAANGTSYANRAPLFNAGTISTIITGFNFSGSDSLFCIIEAGSYTQSATTNNTSFANPPTMANPLIMNAGTGGNLWEPPHGWSSATPFPSTAGQPHITIANDSNWNVTGSHLFGICVEGSIAGTVCACSSFQWGTVTNNRTNSSLSACISGSVPFAVANSQLRCVGDGWNVILSLTTIGASAFNVRVVGNSAASIASNRRGIAVGGNSGFTVSQCTVIDCVNEGMIHTNAGTSSRAFVFNNLFYNCGTGIAVTAPTSATNILNATYNQFVNCGTGINSLATQIIRLNRFKGNTTVTNNQDNFPVTDSNWIDSIADNLVFKDQPNGDYRIKYGSTYWGKGIGAGDEPAPTKNSTAYIF
jgi:hypothetical protein